MPKKYPKPKQAPRKSKPKRPPRRQRKSDGRYYSTKARK